MTIPFEVSTEPSQPDGVRVLITEDEDCAGGELCAVLFITEDGIESSFILEVCDGDESEFSSKWADTCESTGWPIKDETLSDDED